ncbi:putative nucleotidyltransferase [Clostridium punense]|uniref:Nucleotidyltransferase n=1 Tax=Clostridium punense TaxID=1054297 RepID=A0ABS4K500_9CLOT|nr:MULTISPECIES: nucleotidyltransferase domain-containing protein [Clostridium]EQB86167.1 DNA polymerase [Clostridium sp. BL8]MBP2022856.1 putative nucleotidyltransferase [Clostridium punense]
MVDNIIQLVIEKVSSLPCIEGIVLGGSRARGTNTEDSDIDIGIYYNSESFDLTTINQLATELDDEHRSNLVVPLGEWGDWVNGGGWLVINGYHVDLILRDKKRVEKIIKDTEQGIVTANYQTGHPHGYISAMYRGELAISRVQYTNDENFYQLKKQAERYPTALQKGLAEFFMFEADFSLMFAENNIDKDDVSYVCGHCFRSISSLNQVLFAVNREYCINEKKAVKMIEDFKIKPNDYKGRVDKVISLISTDVDCTRKGIEILQRLVNEVEHLKGANIQ